MDLTWLVAWSPFAFLSTAPDFSYLQLKSPLEKCQGTTRLALLLDSNATVWEVTIPRGTTDLRPKEVRSLCGVRGVACNDMTAFAWTQTGVVFVWGQDPCEDGLFGVSGVYASCELVQVPGIEKITQVTVGKSHAAAIDDQGRLFTWGSGDFGQLGSESFTEHLAPPRLVDSARIFRCREVVCGATYTAISTSTGALYIYGSLTTQKRQFRHRPLPSRFPILGQENRPYTFPEGSIILCGSLTAGIGFIAFLSREFLPTAVDHCLDLVKLPVREGDRVTHLSAISETLYGLSGNELYEWREPQTMVVRPWDKPVCLLHDWVSSIYALKEELGRVVLPVNTCGTADLAVLITQNKAEYPIELIGSTKSQAAPVQSKRERERERYASILLRNLRLEQVGKFGRLIQFQLNCRTKMGFEAMRNQKKIEKAVTQIEITVLKYAWRAIFMHQKDRLEQKTQVEIPRFGQRETSRLINTFQRIIRRKQGREAQLRLVRVMLQWRLFTRNQRNRLQTAAHTMYRRLRMMLKQYTATVFPRLRLCLYQDPPRQSLDPIRPRTVSMHHYKPPWRAPQPTGAAKNSKAGYHQRQRRLQYSERLKQRHQEICRQRGLRLLAVMRCTTERRLQGLWRVLMGGRSERLELRWKVEILSLSLRNASVKWQKRYVLSRLDT